MKAAVYARYSSDLQNDRSIEDQIALCEDFARRQGLTIVSAFHDRARSGASVIGRDGVLALMDAARAGTFDVVIVEALDRLSRDQEDLAGIYKRLTHAGIEIRAVHDGKADIVQIGIRGLVGALYLQDLAHKVRRGLQGVIRDGRNAGGKPYGYAPVPGRKGELQILDDEAAVLRRIYADYLAGRSTRDIAGDLNREGVKPPRGHAWAASTLIGNPKRGNGLLQNPIYDGRLIWNRTRMVKDPETGKRVSRINPESEWLQAEAPELRIIDAETFAAVQQRKAGRARGEQPQQRKNARVLSGLLKCGVCGAGCQVLDRWRGQYRVMCSQAKETKSCDNRHRFRLEAIEDGVLAGLKRRLADRREVDYFVKVYNEERQRLAAGAGAERAKMENRLRAAEREFERAADYAVKGIFSEAEARSRLAELRAERNDLEKRLQAMPEAPKVIALHPALVTRYLAALERLGDELATSDRSSAELRAAVRDVIEAVVLNPPAARGAGTSIEIRGTLGRFVQEGDAVPFVGGPPKAGLRYHPVKSVLPLTSETTSTAILAMSSAAHGHRVDRRAAGGSRFASSHRTRDLHEHDSEDDQRARNQAQRRRGFAKHEDADRESTDCADACPDRIGSAKWQRLHGDRQQREARNHGDDGDGARHE